MEDDRRATPEETGDTGTETFQHLGTRAKESSLRGRKSNVIFTPFKQSEKEEESD